MRIDSRAFASTATAIAAGELQGRLEAEAERRQRDLAAYQQAVSQFQLGHQLEQEARARASDPYRLALQYAPGVRPDVRAGYISEAVGNIGRIENEPFAFGAPQLNQLQEAYRHRNPNAAPFSLPALPATNNPWVPMVPPQGAFAPQDQGQPQPPPPPQPDTGAAAPSGPPLVHATPELLQAFGTVLGQPRTETTPPTTDEMAQRAVAAAFPPQAAPPANPLGNQLTYATNQQFPGVPPLSSPNQPPSLPDQMPMPGLPPSVQLQPGQNAENLAQQFYGLPPAMRQAVQAGAPQSVALDLHGGLAAVQTRQQGVSQYAAAQGGPSGSNPQATQPPNTRGQIPDQTPASFAPTGAAPSPAAPPSPVPPSASIGTAPLTVPGGVAPGTALPPPNVLHIPGFSRDYAYGEVDQRTQTLAVTRRQNAIGKLANVRLTPDARAQLDDLLSQSPPPDTVVGLQAYDRITSAIESLGAGQGSSIVRAEQAAASIEPRLMQQFLAIVGKSGRAGDPVFIRQLALGLGNGELAPLADVLAAGQFDAPALRQLLQKSIDRIYTPGFGQLDKSTQGSLLDAAKAYAQLLGEPIALPAQVILQLTPEQRARLDLSRTQVGIADRQATTAEARLQLERDRLNAQIEGKIGGSRTAQGRLITANGQLNAAGKIYEDANTTLRSFLHRKDYSQAVEDYYAEKNRRLNEGRDEAAVITALIGKQNDPPIQQLARLDLARYRALKQYQQTAEGLAQSAGTAAVAPAAPAAVAVPAGPPGRNYGVPAPGAAPPVEMILTNPAGQKRRVVKDPNAVARFLLTQHPDWTLAQAQRQVHQMIQEAKRRGHR